MIRVEISGLLAAAELSVRADAVTQHLTRGGYTVTKRDPSTGLPAAVTKDGKAVYPVKVEIAQPQPQPPTP